MDLKARFNGMLNHPTEVDPASDDLDVLVTRYPYCQSIKFLIARNKNVLALEGADDALALAAIYAPDRAVLFNFMNLKFEVVDPVSEEHVPPEPEKEISFRELEQSELDPNPQPDVNLDEWALKQLDELKNNSASDQNPVQYVFQTAAPLPALEAHHVEPVAEAGPTFSEEIPVRKTFLYWLKKTQKGYFLSSGDAAASAGHESSIRLDQEEEIKKVHEVDSLEKTLQENLLTLGTAEMLSTQEIEFDLTNKEDLLIERYLRKTQQHIKPNKSQQTDHEVEAMVERAATEDEFYTETIAEILYQQKHYDKAIRAYEYLCLKKPEKCASFTSFIEKIRHEAGLSATL